MKSILIIEDERDVVDLLTLQLKKAGDYAVSAALDGAVGLRQARADKPSLILLDLMLPSMPGLEICKVLKGDPATRHIPIIILSAKAEEIDRIVGLELGADDYVTKPFSPREVALRVKALLSRQNGEAPEELLTAGPIAIDPARNNVTVDGKSISLTALEFKLLSKLVRGRGRIHGRDHLLSEVWGYEGAVDTRTVDTHIRRLRLKLGKAGRSVMTVRGFGYRMRQD